VLIGSMILPLPNATDTALSAAICCPAYVTLHDCLVEPDRDQDNPVLQAFLFEGGVEFPLDPAALDRMFR
jgi:hypothetical protein